MHITSCTGSITLKPCRIDSHYVIKVADFGLAESIETKEYIRLDRRQGVKLPVKWLAPESLSDMVFSEKTDVVCTTSSASLHTQYHAVYIENPYCTLC